MIVGGRELTDRLYPQSCLPLAGLAEGWPCANFRCFHCSNERVRPTKVPTELDRERGENFVAGSIHLMPQWSPQNLESLEVWHPYRAFSIGASR